MLLQSLMSQRQTQVDRRAQKQSAWPAGANQASATNGQQGAFQPGGVLGATPSHSQQYGQAGPGAGMSIVDFDFGDDEDDPDFVPNNINMDFGNSAEFANALAAVSGGSGQNLHVSQPEQMEGDSVLSDDQCWQKVLDTFTSNENPGTSTNSASSTQAAHRTRSISRNGETTGHKEDGSAMPNTNATQPKLSEKREAKARSASDASNGEVEADEDDAKDVPQGSKGKRKSLSKEEALARRRQVNRECARRQRERKKQEAEELRRELERFERSRAEGRPVDENAVSLTLPLLRPGKPGRPLGSKNRRPEKDKPSEEPKIDHEELLDLRADNRMLRAEMHRLNEENAQLRARLLRYEDLFDMRGEPDLRKRKRGQGSYEDVDEKGEERSTYVGENAARALAYDPFRDVIREAAGLDQTKASRWRSSDAPARRQDIERPPHSRDIRRAKGVQPPMEAERSIADIAAELVSNPKAVERLVASLKQQSAAVDPKGSVATPRIDEGRGGIQGPPDTRSRRRLPSPLASEDMLPFSQKLPNGRQRAAPSTTPTSRTAYPHEQAGSNASLHNVLRAAGDDMSSIGGGGGGRARPQPL